MVVCEPVSCSEFVEPPLTATPVMPVAENVPLPVGTENVTVISDDPASTSPTDMPVSLVGVSSVITIDAGTDDGVAPGNVFSVYRIMYPSVPTPRNVVGEATIVSVRERTSTAKVTYARKEIMLGDQVQLR